MIPRKRLMKVGALALATSLALTACGSGDDGDDTADGADSSAIITVNGTEPQNPLIPSMTNEVGGGLVITNTFAGLVYYDPEGEPVNEMAESIESDDNQTWTIKIKDGWEFSDGTPVTAESFAKAWDWSANLKNATNLSYFFEPFKGFSYDKNSSIMKSGGVTAVDDTTLEVVLSQPESDFPIRLGYAAFAPLPEVFYDDPEAFGEEPVTNGPYQVASWEHNSKIELRPYDGYQGGREVANGGIDLNNYTQEDAAYNDVLAGNLDVITNVPASSFATYEDELPGSVNQPAAIIQTLNIAENLPEYQGEAGKLRRQALSLAMNREEISETVYDGTRTPATDFTSPVVNGYSEDIPGNEILEYDPDEAKKLWDEADSIDPWGDKVLQIASNADSDHQTWVDAVCNNYRNVLEIECEFKGYPTFDEFLDARDNRKVPGPFRGGWQADYPAMSNFLGPIYGTGAGSNDMDYSNEEVDSLLKQGNAAETPEEAVDFYKQAQSVLFEELPGIPMWYSNVTAGWGDTVDNVQFGWDSDPVLYQITKSE